MIFLTAAPASAGPGESGFATATTSLRAAHGLRPLRTCPDLTALARSWAAHMAAGATLAHNGALAAQVAGWRGIGENVGTGPSAGVIQAALVASPGHLANLLSGSFTEVGYGTAVARNGMLYVDEVFRTPSGGPCAGAAITATPARQAPPSATPPAVVPPAAHERATPAAGAPAAVAAPTSATGAPTAGPAPALTAPAPAPVDRSTVAAARLATDLRRADPERDVVAAAFDFHATLVAAFR